MALSPVRVNVETPTVTINQSAVIMGGIFFAFFIYITAKGELPKYMGFFV